LEHATTIEAQNLAHPLLPAASRVGNDVTVGPRGTVLLVTGSNMAGKSTLLRTVGLNVVLAQLGAPVCATSMTLPRVRVRTVMHVRDSIASGTSLFLAELLRLREVVTAAHEPSGPLLLYLADEILHGTNADDRRIAICAILSDLLEHGAIGAMATHLVGLENESALAAHVRAVHFTEHYDKTAAGLVMRFDYRLRAGPATTRNALQLLESIGVHTRQ
jgi:DNA mismatch repair ATPase MutS